MDTKEFRIFGLKVFEKRSGILPINTGTIANPTDALITALGGSNMVGDIPVTVESALTLSAVWRAMNVISGTLAGLPLKHYLKTDSGRTELKKSSALSLLKRPNNFMTGFIWRESLMAVCLGYGNAYSIIKRNASAVATETIPIHPDNCIPFKDDSKMWYLVRVDDKSYVVPSENMLHFPGLSFNGLVGKAPIGIARESLGGAMATQKFGNNFFANGANIGGVLSTPGEMSDTVYNRLKTSWAERYQGVNNSNKVAILEGGTTFEKIGIPPEDAQFIQTRNFHTTEVARWFGVPPHLLMDLERSTNNNIEHQGMEFVTYTLLPWANRWEEELQRKIIRTDKQDEEYFEHDFGGLLRGDAKSRAEYYKGLFAIGAISPAMIAQLENLPKPPNGDSFYIQGAYVPADQVDTFYKAKGDGAK